MFFLIPGPQQAPEDLPRDLGLPHIRTTERSACCKQSCQTATGRAFPVRRDQSVSIGFLSCRFLTAEGEQTVPHPGLFQPKVEIPAAEIDGRRVPVQKGSLLLQPKIRQITMKIAFHTFGVRFGEKEPGILHLKAEQKRVETAARIGGKNGAGIPFLLLQRRKQIPRIAAGKIGNGRVPQMTEKILVQQLPASFRLKRQGKHQNPGAVFCPADPAENLLPFRALGHTDEVLRRAHKGGRLAAHTAQLLQHPVAKALDTAFSAERVLQLGELSGIRLKRSRTLVAKSGDGEAPLGFSEEVDGRKALVQLQPKIMVQIQLQQSAVIVIHRIGKYQMDQGLG